MGRSNCLESCLVAVLQVWPARVALEESYILAQTTDEKADAVVKPSEKNQFDYLTGAIERLMPPHYLPPSIYISRYTSKWKLCWQEIWPGLPCPLYTNAAQHNE